MKRVMCALAFGFVSLVFPGLCAWAGTSYTYNISCTTGNWKYYFLTVPSGTARLRVETYGGTGDSDLYLRYPTYPTTTAYWRRSNQIGNVDYVDVANPPAGRLYIGLNAFATFSGVTLKATETTASSNWQTEMRNRVNYERSRVGAVALAWNTPLVTAAQLHANDMALHNFSGHTGSDGASTFTRIQRQGYFSGYGSYGYGENVAAGQPTVAAVMTAWMNSPGHKANILNVNFRDFGCGYRYNAAAYYDYYWCQTFGYRH